MFSKCCEVKPVRGIKINSVICDKQLFSFCSFARRFSLFAFGFSLLLCFSCISAAAQDEQPPQQQPQPEDAAPPPLKMISRAEKSSLDAEADISSRTKLSLTLMENRLGSAESFYNQNRFDEMFVELGGFSALINNALDFLKKNDNGRNGKVLNNFKRLELNLRRFAPRIELIRRELPAKYEFYVRGLLKTVRAARSQAVEPMFADTVVPK